MTLEDLMGTDDNPVSADVFVLRVKALLRQRSGPEIEDAHFTVFNAISCIDYLCPTEAILDEIDRILKDYIQTCRKPSEADGMLCDLLVDHWDQDRAAKLIEVTFLECRYSHRREELIREFKWHTGIVRDPSRAKVVRAALDCARRGLRKRNKSLRRQMRLLLDVLSELGAVSE